MSSPPLRSPGALGGGPRSSSMTSWPTAAASCSTSSSAARRDGTSRTTASTYSRTRAPTPDGGVPAVHDPDMATGVYDDPERRVQPGGRRHHHHPQRAPTEVPAAPRPPPPSSGPSTCSPPRSGWTPPRCGAATCIPPDAFPYTTPTGAVYDAATTPPALDMALDAAGYDELRAEQARRRASRRSRAARHRRWPPTWRSPRSRRPGRVRPVEVHPTAAPPSTPAPRPRPGPRHRLGDAGQRAIGIPMDRIDVVARRHRPGVPRGRHVGSRSLQLGGLGGVRRHREARRGGPAGRRRAARGRPGRHRARRRAGACSTWPATPAVPRWAGGASAEARRGRPTPLESVADFTARTPTFPFGAHVAVVEVDTETGAVELCAASSPCDDAGTILNPLLVEGQRHGGIAQGVAQALIEEVLFDEDGNPLTATFADYAIISAAELPSFELRHHGDPDAAQPAGGQGHRRVGHHRLHPGRAERGRRCPVAPRRAARRHARCTAQRVWTAMRDATS